MSRTLLQILLPLLLPTAIFFLWTWLFPRQSVSAEGAGHVRDAPWFWLILAGFVLMAGGLTATALTQGGEAGSRIIQPRYEDGRIVPAEIQ